MTVAIIVTIILAAIVLLFVLEPVIRARQDRVEIDVIVTPDRLPDFRALLAEHSEEDSPSAARSEQGDEERPAPTSERATPISTSPEPAERRP